MSDETIRYVFQDSANIIRGHEQPGYAADTSLAREVMLQRHATDMRANAARRGIDYNHDLETIHGTVHLAMPNAPSPVKRAMARVMMVVRLRTGMQDAQHTAVMYEHLRTDPQYGPIPGETSPVRGLSGRSRQDPRRQQPANTELENGVTMADLFNPSGGRPEAPESQWTPGAQWYPVPEPIREHSSRSDFHRNQRENSGLEGDRQRAAGAARAVTRTGYQPEQVQQYRIAWESPDTWVTPSYTYQISQMEDEHLWTTLHWIMTNMQALFAEYGNQRADTPAALQAKHWLRNRTTFRSMLQEALRRGLTFQRDHFVYLRDYVVRFDPDQGEVLQPTQPWRNPAMAYQRNDLAGFLEEPAAVPEPEDYGKEFRAIDIDP